MYIFPIYGTPPKPDPSDPDENAFLHLPSEFPRFDRVVDAKYIVNLDNEVFTVDYGAHFKLGNIPRTVNVSGLATVAKTDPENPLYSDDCDASHIASPDLQLPGRIQEIGYAARTVTPRIDIGDVRNHFLVRVLAEFNHAFDFVIRRFGRQWAPDSFPFRELSFARLFVASGRAKLLRFREGLCHPRTCMHNQFGMCDRPGPGRFTSLRDMDKAHGLPQTGYFDQRWASNAPLFEFGTMFHRPGERPGVSPAETMYWLDGVLISLVLMVDGAAVTAAAAWGLQQGRSNFQLIVMSLFEVILAEVSMETGPKRKKKADPFVRLSNPLKLSAMSEEEYATINPERSEELKTRTQQGNKFTRDERSQQSQRFKSHLNPGFGALITFFDVAARRRCAAKTPGVLPSEMYCKILDQVDYDTWRTCLTVSPAFRSYCLLKYRLDDRYILPFQPESLLSVSRQKPFFCMELMDSHTGLSHSTVEKEYESRCHGLPRFNWMPIIGTEPRALMVSVLLEFLEPGGRADETDETDESDETDETDESDESGESDGGS